ncbi:MAG: dsRBD fold-containing protein [Gemmatimonadaceae bacterium]
MNKTIYLTALVSDETAVVEASAPTRTENGEGSLSGTGWAKKHPNDKPDVEVGYNLAVARALRDLADSYELLANEAMENPVKTFDMSGYVTGPVEMTYGGLADVNDTRIKYSIPNAKISTVGRF